MPVDAAAAKSVFLAALEKADPGERAAYLDQACAGDASLRARVEELLTGHESGSFPDFLAEAAPAFEPTRAVDSTPHDPTQTSDGTHPGAGISLSFLAPPRDPANLGRLDHYEVQSVLGHGGMGVVLKAFDESLDRIVAIKVLGSQYAANGTARRRFIREAKAVAAVRHENVVHIYDIDEDVPYLVIEYIKGVSLQDRIDQKGPLELKEILRIGMQIAAGLAAAHSQGIVHRDIKPSNILLENGIERVKLTDFGLARAVDDASVTQSGVIAGTPMYMSPEQARGEAVDPRSDLFSLGSVLYAMCTGHAPFRASGTMAVMKRVIEDRPRSACQQNADVPDWLEAIVFKLLEKKPEDRFQSAKEVAALLEQHLAHLQQPAVVAMPARVEPPHRMSRPPQPPPRRKRGWVVPVIVGSVLLVTCAPVLIGVLLFLLWGFRADSPSQSRSTMMIGPRPQDELVVGPAMRGDENLKVVLDSNLLQIDVESEEGTRYQPPFEALESAYKLPPGRYHVRVYRRGKPWVLVFQQKVNLKSGETQTLRVDSTWTQLFNGKDLTGWKVFPADRKNWTVKEGVLTGNGAPSHLFSERGDYSNVYLRMEMRVNKGGACGQWARIPFGDPKNLHYPYGDGSLYSKPVAALYSKDGRVSDPGQPTYRPSALMVSGVGLGKDDPNCVLKVPENEWFVWEVILDGNTLVVKAPGISHSLPYFRSSATAGHLALQLFDADSVVECRRIEVKELRSAPTGDAARLQGKWRLVEGEFGGVKLSGDDLKLVHLSFTGDRFRGGLPPKGLVGEGTFTVDESANPKQVTIKTTSEDGQPLQGIYAFDGERLMVCIGGGNDPRPKGFSTRVGKSYALMVLERDADSPLKLTPPKVLQHMVGAWKIEYTAPEGQPKGGGPMGKYLMIVEPIAGGQFYRVVNQSQSGDPSGVVIDTFDKDRGEFLNWYFDANGFVSNQAAGRFDGTTNTLTMTSVVRDSYVQVSQHKFINADTAEFTVTVRDKMSRPVFDMKGIAKRLPPGKAPAEAAGAKQMLPKEMEVLDRLVDTWETDMASKVRPDDKWKTQITCRKVLGGRYIEQRERVLPSGEENYTLMTYDPQLKKYRQWYFSSRWPQAEGTGTWEEASQTMTWDCEGGAGTTTPIKTSMVWKFASSDKTDFHAVVKDKQGKVLEDIEGTYKRRPAPK